ncbi:hypothetical protein N0B44_32405 [Roseibacterium beibuensis]|uniref:hypothetical protein n=1 Tax=[Roseibacterium] beibuensis TaxID=1193142 RepID=UPI00217D7496|nr:hypothetical protein [Roseibacterium beibuensis]MCS6627616.1 hypothetical protein [Roseibacterium beibuensis]
MRMRALFVLSALAAGAAACATVETAAPVAVSEPAPPAAGSPSPVDGYDWFYSPDEDTARLAYGLAESDDLKLGLDCGRGTGRVEMVAIAEKGAKAEIHVESGGDTERFSAASEPSQLNDGVILTASASTAEPVFQRFRRVGWMALWRDGEREAYAPQPGSGPNIERFFAFCG